MKVMLGLLALITLTSTSASAKPLRFREHQTERGSVNLAIYEKWQGGLEQSWRKNGKVILLIHGATWSSRCTFDPSPGFSLMEELANAGYDVFALDLHGYGKSERKADDWSEASSTLEDVDAAVDYIRALRWVDKVHILGYQWGAQVAGLYASSKPAKVGRLALFGLRYRTVDKRSLPETPLRNNSSQTATLKPEDGDFDPQFTSVRAAACLRWDPQSPNGAIRDLAQPSSVDPARIVVPTLLLMGERDNEPKLMNDRLDFFQLLAAPEKWMIVVPLVGKYGIIERDRARVEAALLQFLKQ